MSQFDPVRMMPSEPPAPAPEPAGEASPIREAISEAISEHRVILFMKGTPEAPACGFSARTVAALQALEAPFAAVDVLPDPRIRQELSATLQLADDPAAVRRRRAGRRLRHRARDVRVGRARGSAQVAGAPANASAAVAAGALL